MSARPSPASSTDRRIQTGLLSGVAYAGMLVFGVVMAMLGAILPSLSSRLKFDVADIGTLFLAMNFSMVVCNLVVGAAVDRFGMKPALVLGCLIVGAAVALVTRAIQFHDLMLPVALLGIGGAALNCATNTLVADLHDDPKRKSSALNLLGMFFGFGAVLLPISIGALVATFGIDALILSAAALCVLAGLAAVPLTFPPPKQKQSLPLTEIPRFVGSPVVLVMAFLLFFESGVEFTSSGFISTYMTRAMQFSVEAASWTLAAYWIAVMAARAIMSRIALGADPHRIVLGCAAGAFLGSVITTFAPNSTIAIAGLMISGFAMSSIFPTVLGIAGARYQAHSGTVFGILLTVALLGGMTVPWAAGQIAGAAGLRWIFGLIAGCFVAVAVLARVSSRYGVAAKV